VWCGDALLDLADSMPSPEMTFEIVPVATAAEGIQGSTKCSHEKTCLQDHIDRRIEVDPALTVAASHTIAGRVRRL
jgi:divalent metal cation (Fe/Co/Zn/Cd) transporter